MRSSAHGSTVSFRLRRLEPPLAWAIAAFTLWSAVFLYPREPAVWLGAAYATAIGFWAREYPAHRQLFMLARALLLLCGALTLQVVAEAGGPAGPYFLWSVLVSTLYAVLLPRTWALGVAAVALVLYVIACVFHPPSSWQQAATFAGALGFFPFMATLFGRVLQAMDQQAESAATDRRSKLFNEAGFFAYGGELLDECRRKKRPYSLVLLDSADLHEVADLAGPKAASQVFAQLATDLAQATPRGGLAARTDAVEFALALPGLTAEQAATLVREHLGAPPKVEFTAGGNKVTVILDTAIAEATPDFPSLEDFYERLRRQLHDRAVAASVVPSSLPSNYGASTLEGLLEDARPVPHFDRPTMPMMFDDKPEG